MTINERVNTIITELYNGNKRAFSIYIGVSPTVIENVVGTRQGKPSYDVLEKICAKANISGDWLLTGNGSMLKTPTASEPPCNPITTPSEPSSDSPIALLIKHIDSLTRENERQKLQIATLESRLGQNEA